MKKQLAIVILVLAVIFTVGLVIGVLLPRLAGFGMARGHVYNTSAIVQQVQTLSELVTVKYVMEKVVIQEDPPQSTIRRFFPDDTRVILVGLEQDAAGRCAAFGQAGHVGTSKGANNRRLPRRKGDENS
jgi:hypothetical protein